VLSVRLRSYQLVVKYAYMSELLSSTLMELTGMEKAF
jgi:hypothetical protein